MFSFLAHFIELHFPTLQSFPNCKNTTIALKYFTLDKKDQNFCNSNFKFFRLAMILVVVGHLLQFITVQNA